MTPRPRSPSHSVALRAEPFPTVHLARDHLKSVVARRVRTGEWLRVRPGAYIDARLELSPHDRRRRLALARIIATASLTSGYDCFSHVSAALIWGLPLTRLPDRTHVIQQLPPGARSARSMVRHVLHLPDAHRTAHRNLPVTTLARTAIDCARVLEPLDALVVADGALARGATRSDVVGMLAELAGLPGITAARQLLDLADAGAESPGETRTRFALLRAGLPRPETQIEVTTHLGSFWADLGWKRWRLLLEYDGRPKYEDRGYEALMAEKRRHDALVEAGYRVLRVTKEDLREPQRFVDRVVAHLPPSVIAKCTVPRVLRPAPFAVAA